MYKPLHFQSWVQMLTNAYKSIICAFNNTMLYIHYRPTLFECIYIRTKPFCCHLTFHHAIIHNSHVYLLNMFFSPKPKLPAMQSRCIHGLRHSSGCPTLPGLGQQATGCPNAVVMPHPWSQRVVVGEYGEAPHWIMAKQCFETAVVTWLGLQQLRVRESERNKWKLDSLIITYSKLVHEVNTRWNI